MATPLGTYVDPRAQRWWGVPRPWAEAGLYAVLAVVAAAVGLSGLWSVFSVIPEPVSSWWSLVLALPACVAVVTKYRHPVASLAAVAALVVVDMMTVGGIVPFVVLLDVLYIVVLEATPAARRRILVAGVVVVAVAAGLTLWRTGDLRVAILIPLQWGAVGGLVYWYATSVGQSRELVELHRRAARDAAALAERDRDAAVEHERERMARELHDLVAGHVSAIAIRSEAALTAPDSADARGRDHAVQRDALAAVRDASLDAHDALRQMIAVLRGGDGDLASPRRETVPLLAEAGRRAGLTVEVDDSLEGALAGAVDIAVGRIVQESLANAARHASGSTVTVAIGGDDSEVRVEVTTRGGGQPPALAGNGWGLQLLRERTRALGGDFDAGPDHDGWTVRARLPRGVPA